MPGIFGRWAVVFVCGVALAGPELGARDFYVAPDGSPRGNGSRRRPWDIATALSHPVRVKAGDTIRLRGGRYAPDDTLVGSLRGEPGRPIVVRQMSHERATLDCIAITANQPGSDCLQIVGEHTWYWGFEIMNSSLTRWTNVTGSQADPRGIGVHSQGGPGTKLINLVIHDVGTTLFESQPSGIELYGTIAYNSGWDAPDRSHGPGFYIRNRSTSPAKLIRDNVLFQHFRQALQGYGSFHNVFSNFLVEGNVLFNNGIGRGGLHRNLMFGNSNSDHRNNAFVENYTYYASGNERGSNMFGQADGGCAGLTIRGNVFSQGPGRTAAEIHHCDEVTIADNHFYGKTSYSNGDGTIEVSNDSFRRHFPDNRYFGDGKPEPTDTLVVVRANQYEANRANIVVYNWSAECSVQADLSTLRIPFGARYELRNVRDYFGRGLRGVYRGQAITIPMSGWRVQQPLGDFQGELPATEPEFGAFVLTWRVAPWLSRRSRMLSAFDSPAQRFQVALACVTR